MYGLLIMAK